MAVQNIPPAAPTAAVSVPLAPKPVTPIGGTLSQHHHHSLFLSWLAWLVTLLRDVLRLNIHVVRVEQKQQQQQHHQPPNHSPTLHMHMPMPTDLQQVHFFFAHHHVAPSSADDSSVTVAARAADRRRLEARNAALEAATRDLRGLLVAERAAREQVHRVHQLARQKIEKLEATVADLASRLKAYEGGGDGCGGEEETGIATVAEAVNDALDAKRYFERRFALGGWTCGGEDGLDAERDDDAAKCAEADEVQEDDDVEDDDDDDGGYDSYDENDTRSGSDLEDPTSMNEIGSESGSAASSGVTDFVTLVTKKLNQPMASASTPLSLSLLIDDLVQKHSPEPTLASRGALRALLNHHSAIAASHPVNAIVTAQQRLAKSLRAALSTYSILLTTQATTAVDRVALIDELAVWCESPHRLQDIRAGCFAVLVFAMWQAGVVSGPDVLTFWKDNGAATGRVVMRSLETFVNGLESSDDDDDEDDDDEEEDDEDEDDDDANDDDAGEQGLDDFNGCGVVVPYGKDESLGKHDGPHVSFAEC